MANAYALIQCAYQARTFEYEVARAQLSTELDLKCKTERLDALTKSGGAVDKAEYLQAVRDWEAARKELDDRLDSMFPDLMDCYDPLTWFGKAKKVYGVEALREVVAPQPLMSKVCTKVKDILNSFILFYKPLFVKNVDELSAV